MSHTLHIARRLVDAGISVLPVGADQLPVASMLPLVAGERTWKPLRDRLPTDGELVAWFGRDEAAPARIHGGISGECETIRIIDPRGDVYRRWSGAVEAVLPGLLDRLTRIAIPGGGWHVFYRCVGPVEESQTLAEAPADKGRWSGLIETRGRGDFCVCPGGPMRFPHYQVFSGPPVWHPATLSVEERAVLLAAARACDQRRRPAAGGDGGTRAGVESERGPGRQNHRDRPRAEPPGEAWRLKVVSGLDVEPKEIEWLWPGRIPAGKLTILAALPGVGTTFVSCHLAARVTTGGSWADGCGQAPLGEVVFLNSEDSLADTLLPRLIAQGVDRSKVHFLEAVQEQDGEGRPIERAVRFDIDIENLRRFLEVRPQVRLLVVDPIGAYLGGTDREKKGEVRAGLGPLCKLAEDFGVAVVGISHLSNGGRGAVKRTSGNMAVVEHAPVVWGHVQDPEDSERVLWLPVKMKLARRPRGLAYRIVEGRVEWETGGVEVSAEEAMNPTPPKRDRIGEAGDWLRRQLAGGEWVKSAEIEAKLDAAGISFTTYKRAKKVLEVESSKGCGTGGWCMRLPQESPGSRGGAAELPDPDDPDELLDPDETLEPLESDETLELLESVETVPSLAHSPTLNKEDSGACVTQGDEEDEWADFERAFADFEEEPP